MNEFNSDRVLLQQRMIHAFQTLKNFDKVDENKTGAIGFCFGGKCALDLARAGEDVKGVVSFHGLYDAPTASSGKQLKGSIKIDSSILILHGYDDPMATPQNMIDLADELNSKKANWQIHAYGNVDMLLQILKLMIETQDYSTMRMRISTHGERCLIFLKKFFLEIIIQTSN